MTRAPLSSLLLAFATGVAYLQTRGELPQRPLWYCIVAMVLLATALYAPCARARSPPVLLLGLASVAAVLATGYMGFGYAAWRAQSRMADELPRQWEAVDVRIVGVVGGLPTKSPQGVRFAFDVERIITPGAAVPEHLSLAWYGGSTFGRPEIPTAPVPSVRTGERWALTVRLKRPHGTVNPGGFDLEGWLLANGFRATGYVHGDSDGERLATFAGRPDDYVQRARERIRERINRALPAATYAGVVVALTVGDQRAVPEAQWRIFNRTGISHLVSISGLHVTVFATLIGGVATALLRRSHRLTTRIPAVKMGAVVGVVAAAAYVLLAGAEIPAVRTLLMLLVAACGLWCGRPGTAGIVWLWALAVVLAWDPWAPLAAGFWLSFAAVGLLLYASVGRLRRPQAIGVRARFAATLREGTAAQWVVTIGLIPLTLLLFQQFSLVAPLANAFAIPVVTLAVVPLVLTGIVVPLDFLFQLAHLILTWLMVPLTLLAQLPGSAWEQHAPPLWTVGVALLGVVWLIAPRGVPARSLGLIALLPLTLVRPVSPAEGAFRVTVLDVGQGLASIVQTRRHTLIYDTGPRFTETADAGGRIVAPFLRATGVGRASGLILSHVDLDHVGGALSLMQTVPFDWMASSLPEDHAIVVRASQEAAVVRCSAGQRWTWDGVHFTVLHPTAVEYADAVAKTNDRSCVVRVDSMYGSALLTGDIEAVSEALLLRTDPVQLAADILVVPHHGSRTSSTPAFVAAVAPQLAIFAAGYRNRFGHPRADIVERYERQGAIAVRTDREGAIRIEVGPEVRPVGRLVVHGARAMDRRYWQDPPVEATQQ